MWRDMIRLTPSKHRVVVLAVRLIYLAMRRYSRVGFILAGPVKPVRRDDFLDGIKYHANGAARKILSFW